VEQGAGAPTAPRVPRQWGLDHDLRPPPTVSHMPSSPSSTGSVGGTSCIQGRLLISKDIHTMGTRLL
jgi:hypothetical protein